MSVNISSRHLADPAVPLVSGLSTTDREVHTAHEVEVLAQWPAGLSYVFDRLHDAFHNINTESVAKDNHLNIVAKDRNNLSTINNNSNSHIDEIKAIANQLSGDSSVEANRELLYSIYTRAAEAIGRNSVEAVRADAIKRLESLVSIGVVTAPEGRKNNPEEFIESKIKPLLDPDMKAFAFDMNIYRSSMRNFYQVLGSWRSRGQAKRIFVSR